MKKKQENRMNMREREAVLRGDQGKMQKKKEVRKSEIGYTEGYFRTPIWDDLAVSRGGRGDSLEEMEESE